MKKKLINPIRNIRTATIILVVFYLVGTIGIALDATRPLFIKLTPFALLLSSFFLIINHKGSSNLQALVVYALIFTGGFLIEMLGVNTGLVFGDYRYGSGLGWQIGNTPVLIGLNWLMLVYTSASILQSLKLNRIAVIIAGASMMVLYDLVLEQVAPTMDMWSWSGNIIPFKNYLTWWIVAAVMHSLVVVFKLKIANRIAFSVFFIQFVFFILLLVIL